MKKVLITGSRNIVALDFSRALSDHGHIVYIADTWHFPMVKNQVGIHTYFKIPSPRFSLTNYLSSLITIITEHEIDVIIPMCEEAFYISAIKAKLSCHCDVFTPDFSLMRRLHDKLDIMRLASNCGIRTPQTTLLKSKEQFEALNPDEIIVKARFSRFGHHVLNGTVAVKQLDTLLVQGNYIVQQKIFGKEYCTYALAKAGKVLCQTVYDPVYRLPHSAAMYFQPHSHPKIAMFVSAFVKKHCITGQIGFDIIDDGNEIYLIECNPRGNSGIHCLHNTDFGSLLFQDKIIDPKNNTEQPVMLGYAMWLIMLPRMLFTGRLTEWRHAMKQARNVLRHHRYRFLSFSGLATIAELLWLMLKNKQSFRMASTNDIEWNGDEINE